MLAPKHVRQNRLEQINIVVWSQSSQSLCVVDIAGHASMEKACILVDNVIRLFFQT